MPPIISARALKVARTSLSTLIVSLDIAQDGIKAIEMWRNECYVLILMDIQMPEVNGFEATRFIREKEREHCRHTPIIAITGNAYKEDGESCIAAGIDAYISKPIDFKMCLQVIGDIIRKTAVP